MQTSPLRTAAVSVLVVGSSALPLIAPVALQYDGGAAPLGVLAGAHFLALAVAARLSCAARKTAAPRVDFVRAEA